jgi:hypothetical protein
MLTVTNLRTYLEKCPYPDGVTADSSGTTQEAGYLNLYTMPQNVEKEVIPNADPNYRGWYQARLLRCSDPNSRLQRGLGAVALVFNNRAVKILLSHQHMVDRVPTADGQWKVDGAVVSTMNKAGWREYVHNPSLVKHIGNPSTVGHARFPDGVGFPGENFNAMSLLT